jgi:hypothetical protein
MIFYPREVESFRPVRHDTRASIHDMKLKNTVPISAKEMMAANERAVLKLKLPDSTK